MGAWFRQKCNVRSSRPSGIVALVFVLYLGSLAPTATGQTGGYSLEYVVDVSPTRPTIHVRLLLESAATSIDLVFWPYSPGAEEHVRNLTTTSDGDSVVPNGARRWTLSAPDGAATVEYDVDRIVPFGGTAAGYGNTNEVAVYASKDVALLMGPYVFLYPGGPDPASIRLRFVAPADWEIFTPYIDRGGFYEPQRIRSSLVEDFVRHDEIYLGKMRFSAHAMAGDTRVQMGVPNADRSCETRDFLGSQGAVQAHVDRAAQGVSGLASVFGENPFTVWTMYTGFMTQCGRTEDYRYSSARYSGNAFWAAGLTDRLIGHMASAFIGNSGVPLSATDRLTMGVTEIFYGTELAWRQSQDPTYLARWYHYYLVYDRLWNDTAAKEATDVDDQFFPGVFAFYLDRKIQEATSGLYGLDDAMAHLYTTYARTERRVGYAELELSILAATGFDAGAIFDTYADYGEKMPLSPYMDPFRSALPDYLAHSQEVFSRTPTYGHMEPLFVLIEYAAARTPHFYDAFIDEGGFLREFESKLESRATPATVTEADVESALAEMTGRNQSGFFTRWADTYGPLSIGAFRDWWKKFSKDPQAGHDPPRGWTKPIPALDGFATLAIVLVVLAGRFRRGGRAQKGAPRSASFVREGEPRRLSYGTVFPRHPEASEGRLVGLGDRRQTAKPR